VNLLAEIQHPAYQQGRVVAEVSMLRVKGARLCEVRCPLWKTRRGLLVAKGKLRQFPSPAWRSAGRSGLGRLGHAAGFGADFLPRAGAPRSCRAKAG